MEALAYIRWSTEDQSRGDSEQRQLKMAKDLCEDRGWTLRETLIENGKSAFHGKHRVGTGKMLQLEQRAARGELAGTAILVENLDRMSRQEPLEGLNLLTSFTKQGITVVETGSGETWTSDKIASHWTALLTAFIRAGLSYEESKKKSNRIKSAWRTTQDRLSTKEGKADRRISPSWIEVVDGEYQVIEARADVIRMMFRLCIEGESLTGIRRWLEERKIPSPRGKPIWLNSGIMAILRSRAALGEYLPQSFHGGDKRKPIGDWKPAFPAIITETVWAQAQASLSSRRDNPGVVKHTFTNVLAGIAKCGSCGGAMTLLGKSRDGKRRLQCKSYKVGRGCRTNTTYTFSPLRDAILDNLGMCLIDRPIHNPSREALIDAKAELQSMKGRIDNLVDALSRNPSEAMERAVLALEQRIGEQEAHVERLSRSSTLESAQLPSSDVVAEIEALRAEMDTDEQVRLRANRLLKQVVDGLILNPSDRSALLILLNGLVAIEFGPDGTVKREANALNQLEQRTYELADGETVSTVPATVIQAATNGDPMRGMMVDRIKDHFGI